MAEFESTVLHFIHTRLHHPLLDKLMILVSRIGDNGEVWFVTMCVLLWQQNSRFTGWILFVTMFLEVLICNVWLKPAFGRRRPFQDKPQITLLVKEPTDCSFPSGHTAAAFAATIALWGCGSGLWVPAVVIAVLTAFSRLYLYVHWPSDVMGGIGLGIVIGFLGQLLGAFTSIWIWALFQ